MFSRVLLNRCFIKCRYLIIQWMSNEMSMGCSGEFVLASILCITLIMYNVAIQLRCNKGTFSVLLAQCIMYHITGYKKRCQVHVHYSPPCKTSHGCSATSTNKHPLSSHKAAVLDCLCAILFLVRIVQNVPLIVFCAPLLSQQFYGIGNLRFL